MRFPCRNGQNVTFILSSAPTLVYAYVLVDPRGRGTAACCVSRPLVLHISPRHSLEGAQDDQPACLVRRWGSICQAGGEFDARVERLVPTSGRLKWRGQVVSRVPSATRSPMSANGSSRAYAVNAGGQIAARTISALSTEPTPQRHAPSLISRWRIGGG